VISFLGFNSTKSLPQLRQISIGKPINGIRQPMMLFGGLKVSFVSRSGFWSFNRFEASGNATQFQRKKIPSELADLFGDAHFASVYRTRQSVFQREFGVGCLESLRG